MLLLLLLLLCVNDHEAQFHLNLIGHWNISETWLDHQNPKPVYSYQQEIRDKKKHSRKRAQSFTEGYLSSYANEDDESAVRL